MSTSDYSQTAIEACREGIERSIRRRNVLIVRREDAEREDRENNRRTTPKHAKRNAPRQGRYDSLRRKIDFTVSIQNMDKELTTQFKAYSQVLLLSLTQSMRTHLPRELRDYVYGYLLARVEMQRFRMYMTHDNMPKNMWVPQPKAFPFTHSWARSPYHYENSEFVGFEFKRELIEMYYRRTTFLLNERSFVLLDTWLEQDPFGCDLLVHQALCSLEISLNFQRPGMKADFGGPNRGYIIDVESAKEMVTLYKEELAEKLAPLTLIKRRCKLLISFGIWIGEIGLFQFQEIADVLIPIIDVLKKNGCMVDIVINQFRLMSYGMERGVGVWRLEHGSDRGLNDARTEYGVSCFENEDAGLVRKFEAEFTPAQ